MLCNKLNNKLISAEELSKLKWRARRGMLENDIILTKFFTQYEKILTIEQAKALEILLDLSDNDLLDFILSKKPIKQEWGNNVLILHILSILQNIY